MIRNLVLATVLSVAATAMADKLVTGSGQGITRDNVKVKDIQGDQLVFDAQGGNESRQPLSSVQKIEVTGEPDFNKAEDDFFKKDGKGASDGYAKVLRGSSKPWMRLRSATRLVELAKETGRFDHAVAGYVELLRSNPELAAASKPSLPEDKASAQLTAAVSDIDKVIADPKLPADRKMALLGFKLDIANHRGDEKTAADTMEQMLKLNPNDPNLQVTVAMNSLKNKEYAKALKAIEDNRSHITDADAQATALYIIAESNYQLALAAKKTDKTAWQDIAISFMRVVAQFSGSPRAPESLARVASCYEQMQDTKQATEVYKQVVKDYPRSAAAKDAETALSRLKAGT
jgi:TolA-binding protein